MNTRTAIIILFVVIVLGAIFEIARMYSTPAAKPPAPIATVLYSCNDSKTIAASYYQGETKPAAGPNLPPTPGGSVAITLSDGRAMTLPQTISADGGRYANADESFVFWDKGNTALVLEGGQEKSYIGCIAAAPLPTEGDLAYVYSNSVDGFSIRLPGTASSTSYTVDGSYRYQELGPGKDIPGIKFTIPASVATGTNLAADSYLSVEEIPKSESPAGGCTATPFLDQQGGTSATQTITDGNTTYSFASSTGAGAGNRYEETVYAVPGTNPCIAVRYLIHYGVIENYPAGLVHEFDKQALLAEFDAIRRTLVVAQ